MALCPVFPLARINHLALALRTGFHIPDANLVAATLEAQASDLAPVGRGDVGDDAPDDEVLNRLAVGTRHGHNLLPEETAPLIRLGLIAALLTAIFPFPGHGYQSMRIRSSEQLTV